MNFIEGFILGIITGFIVELPFYIKQRMDSKRDRAILESLIDADIRLRDDRDRTKMRKGKIAKRKDGTYGIDWEITLTETLGLSDEVTVEKIGKRDAS